MRYFKAALFVAFGSFVIAHASASAQSRMTEASVKSGDAAVVKACAPEIAAMAADARKAGSDIRDGDVPPLITDMPINWWWDDEATAKIRREYRETSRCKGENVYAFAQCAITTIDAWRKGVREPAQLRAGWKPFPAGSASTTAAAKPAASQQQPPHLRRETPSPAPSILTQARLPIACGSTKATKVRRAQESSRWKLANIHRRRPGVRARHS